MARVRIWYHQANVSYDVYASLARTIAGLSGSSNSGWIPGTGSTNHAAMDNGVEVPMASFVNTNDPDGTLNTTTGDAFRTQYPLTGDFASGNWLWFVECSYDTGFSTCQGRIRFRLFRGASPTGSDAVEITSGQLQGSIAIMDGTSTQNESQLTFNPGAFSLNNEYLFVQCAWERTVAGSMSSNDVHWRGNNTTYTRLETSTFTPTAFGGRIDEASSSGAPNSAGVVTDTALAGVGVGDLIFVVASEINANTSVSCSDNLGNTYTPINGGTNGTINNKAFYSIVTTAGNATPSVVGTTSGNAYVIAAAAYKGPFTASPLDVNPSTLNDSADPMVTNASGTLSQADELVIGYFSALASSAHTITPSGADVDAHRISGSNEAVITSTVVSATTSLTMGLTVGGALATVCGIATFKKKSEAKITIDVGAFSFAGQQITLKRNRKVPVDAGAYAFAGQQITLKKGRSAVIGAGAYAFAGQQITFKRTYKESIAVGAFTFAGPQIALEHGYKVTIGAGAFIFTGQDITLTKSVAAKIIPIDAGAYAFAGQQITFKRTYKEVITVGAFTFTGQAITLKRVSKIVIGAGAYAFAGPDIALKRTQKVAIGVGAYTFAGLDIGLKRGRKAVIDVGAYTFAGQQITFRRTYKVSITVGAFVFTGQEIVLTRVGARSLLVQAGAFAFTGQQITLRRTLKVTVGVGAFTFAGQDIALKRGRKAIIGVGAWAFAGQQITFRRTYKVIVTVGAFTFTGQAITLRKTNKITMGTGAYTFTGPNINLKRGRKFAVDVGAWAFAGQNIDFKRGRKVIMNAGNFVFTGQDIALTKGGVAVTNRGSFFHVLQ